ncbi:MAG: GAF domain-containing protein [Fimbriimonas sp.]
MPLATGLAELVAHIAREIEPKAALEAIAEGAMRLTGSRHAFIAVLNEEEGHLEIRAGAGDGVAQDPNPAPSPLPVGDTVGIVGYVAATGEAFVSGDVRQEPRYRVIFPATVSEMAVPVHDRHGRVVAVLNVEAEREGAYTPDVQEIVHILVGLVAMVLEREAHLQREEALVQVASAITAAETEEDLIGRVVEVAEHVLRLQACSIFLIDSTSDTFRLRGTSGALRDLVGRISYARDEGFTGWVCNKRKPILLHHPQGDPRWRGKYVEIPSDEVASFLAVPIVSRGQGIGAFRVLRRKSENRYLDNRFRPDDQRLLQAIAEQIAIGLESVRSTERRIRDERMIAWGELSAKSSHMIGNRVFALKGDLNELGHVLAEPSPALAELAELQQSLTVNVHRIEEILHDFRDFVTATQIHPSPTDVNALIRETASEIFPKRGEVELRLDLDPELPPIEADGKRLRRAISELIENSLIHTPKGHLSVTTCRAEGREDERTKADPAALFVRIELADTGPGVPPEKKGLIFQPFFSGRVRGMGLGLSIVQGIVAAHDGHVYEDGEPGQGACFVILLPIRKG